MVGWSRRNREARDRRTAWWNSLSPEERRTVAASEKEADRVWTRDMLALLVGLTVALLIAFKAFA